MVDEHENSWQTLWQTLAALQQNAQKLRHLSQVEPLLQARPDYPRARIGRSHASEVQQVLDEIAATLTDVQRLLPEVLPDAHRPSGTSAEEEPRALAEKVAFLARLVASLQREAFQPPPPLPAHAPPYLAEAPSHDLAGSKAVLLSLGIEQAVSALRNVILAFLNDPGRTNGQVSE